MTPAIAHGGALQTMTSREIADLCEARHNDVVATILRLFEKGVLRGSRKTPRPFIPVGGGRPTQVYDLDKRDTLVVASGYNDELRARIIDRWEELERAAAAPSPPAINVRDDAQFAEIGIQLQAYAAELRARVAVLEPKAEAFDNLAEPSLGSRTPTQTARALGLGRDDLIADLLKMKWLFRDRRGDLTGYATFVDRGFLEHREHIWKDRWGTPHSSVQVYITPAGRQHLTLHYTTRAGTLLERRSPAALPAPGADLLQ